MSESRYSRQTFILDSIVYLRNRTFDGLDIDWEYPKGEDDKKNYVSLLKVGNCNQPEAHGNVVSKRERERQLKHLQCHKFDYTYGQSDPEYSSDKQVATHVTN